MLAIVSQIRRVAVSDHRVAVVIQVDRVIGDGKYAGQFVSHYYDGRAHGLLDLHNQFIEQARTDRIKTGRRLVEKKDFRIQRDGARQGGSFLHAAANLGG